MRCRLDQLDVGRGWPRELDRNVAWCRDGPHSASRNADRIAMHRKPFNRETPFVRWIEGFEPCRTDMVFARESPSCFAGFAGESAWIPDLDRSGPSQS
jgi:hypothetical protein